MVVDRKKEGRKKMRKENTVAAIAEVQGWLKRNPELTVIEERYTDEFTEIWIKDEGFTTQVYIDRNGNQTVTTYNW